MVAQLFFAGLEFVIPIVILALIAFAIVALVTARRDPDPAGTRPYAIYLVLVIFLAMFTALFALTSVASNVARIPMAERQNGCVSGPGFVSCTAASTTTGLSSSGSGSGSVAPLPSPRPIPLPSVSSYDPGKQQASAAVQGGLVALAALLVLWFHVRRLRELVQEPEFTLAPGRRTYQVYLHAVSFTAAAILIFAGAAALYGLFRIVAPGYTEQFRSHSAERDGGIVQLVSAGVLSIGAFVIFAYHWRRTRTLRGPSPLPPPEQAAPPGPPSDPPPPTPSAAPIPTATPPPAPSPGPSPPSGEAPPPAVPPT